MSCFLSPNVSSLPVSNQTDNIPACFNTSAVVLPKIPVDIRGNKLKVWELYKVETNVMSQTGFVPMSPLDPFQGPCGAIWSASGQPLEVFPTSANPTKDPPFTSAAQSMPVGATGTFDLQSYMINPWQENTKYYQRHDLGGGGPAFADSNSVATLMTDSAGYGVICPNGRCYLTNLDYACQLIGDADIAKAKYQCWQYARYFKCYFRQRWIKSPVLLSDLFDQYTQQATAGYVGEVDNIENVQMITGRQAANPEGLLDPDGVANQ